jgi:hypothetical protein
MGIGAITKQLAQEALGTGVQNVIDTLSDTKPEAAAPKAPDSLAGVILGEVNAMQNALKDDQELLVTCAIGGTTLRVLELFAPAPQILVVTGTDGERGIARLITPAAAVQLLCRPVPVKPDAKPVRLRLVMPKK